MYPRYAMDPNNCYLENCLKFEVFKRENNPYKRGEIMNALKQVIDKDDFLKIDMVSMYGSNLVWMISFKELSIAKKYFGKTIEYNGCCCLVDAHDDNLYSTYRICWLPNLLPLAQIERHFSPYGTVIKCFHETSKEEGCKGIKTGIVQVKLQQTPQQAGDIEVKTGPQRLTSGIRMLVLKAGDKTGCFKCGESNHKAKDCPKKRKPVSYADIASSQTETNDGQNDADAEHALEQVPSTEMETNEPEIVAVAETLRDDQHSTLIEEPVDTPTASTVLGKKSKRKQMSSPSESDKTSKQGRQDDPNSSYQDYSTADSVQDSGSDGEVEELESTVSEHPPLPPDASTPITQVQ